MSISISPRTCQAVVFTTPGEPIQVSVSVPALSQHQVLIRIHAVALNPVDTQLLNWPIGRLIPGQKGLERDFSGEIVEVGSSVDGTEWKIGDEVFGLIFRPFGEGSLKGYLAIDPAKEPGVLKKPNFLSHAQASSLPLVVWTAFSMLEWLPKDLLDKKSDRQGHIVVNGASGGVGIWVVQIAKKFYNVHVTAICSARNAEFATSLGADAIIDYTATDSLSAALLTSLPQGQYDLIADCVGGTQLLPHLSSLLHKTGAYITIVGDKSGRKEMGGPPTYLTHPTQIYRYVVGWAFGPRYACIGLVPNKEKMRELLGLVERKEVQVVIERIVENGFENEGWKQAFETLDGGRSRGKVVVTL